MKYGMDSLSPITHGGYPAERTYTDAEVRQLQAELRTLKAAPFLLRAADRLYGECERAITEGRIDARSPIGDATLDYREVRVEADARMAEGIA